MGTDDRIESFAYDVLVQSISALPEKVVHQRLFFENVRMSFGKAVSPVKQPRKLSIHENMAPRDKAGGRFGDETQGIFYSTVFTLGIKDFFYRSGTGIMSLAGIAAQYQSSHVATAPLPFVAFSVCCILLAIFKSLGRLYR